MRKIFFTLLLLISACTRNVSLHALKDADQNVIYQDSAEIVLKEKKNIVAAQVTQTVFEASGYIKLRIDVKNKSKKDIFVSPEKVAAYTADGKELKVLSVDEIAALMQKAINEERLAAALNAMSATLNAQNAGYSYGYGSGMHSGSIAGHSYSGLSSFNYNHYDGLSAFAATNYAQEKSLAQGRDRINQTINYANNIYDLLLKNHTVAPSEMYGGFVVIKMDEYPSQPKDFFVKVQLDNEFYEFKFQYKAMT